MRLILLIPPLLLTACAASPAEIEQAAAVQSETAARLEQEFAGLTAGQPTNCLPEAARTQVQSRVYGPTIVFAVSRDVKYRNEASGACGRAGGPLRDVLVTQTPNARLCRGDIVRTVDPVSGITSGSCALGDFTPYRRP